MRRCALRRAVDGIPAPGGGGGCRGLPSIRPSGSRPAPALVAQTRWRARSSGARAGEVAGPGGSARAPPPRGGVRCCWARWGARAGCRWCAPGAAGPPGPAGRRASSAAPPGGGRGTSRGRGTARTHGAPYGPPLPAWATRMPRRSARLALALALPGRGRQAQCPPGRDPQDPARHPDRPPPAMLIDDPERRRAAASLGRARPFPECRAPSEPGRARAPAARSRPRGPQGSGPPPPLGTQRCRDARRT